MKKITSLSPAVFIMLLAVFCTTRSVAQTAKSDMASVMIIPFDPNLYFSDSDEQLSKHNNKTIKEVRTLFRYGLNTNVNVKILTNYTTRALLTDTLESARTDLNLIYRDISYFKDKTMPSEEMKKKLAEEKQQKRTFSLQKRDNESDAQVATKLYEPVIQKEYMNVRVQPSMLQYLQKKYGTDLFVFLNQFELVTNYEHCLDRATNTFQRDIKVHFSIFEANGKQLAGDVAIAHFPSNTNDLTEIIRNNFPVISEYLTGNLPNKALPSVNPEPETAPAPVPVSPPKSGETMEFEEDN